MNFTFSMSFQALSFFKSLTASLVRLISSTLSLSTSGTSGVSSIRWPLAMTSAGMPEAAIADTTAYLRCLMLTLRCHLRQVLVGANMRPPRHMLPNAPWPLRWVPPPRTRGIRATARPVPHDSAEAFMPDSSPTANAWRRFLLTWSCTYETTSGRMGARNTDGKRILVSLDAPFLAS